MAIQTQPFTETPGSQLEEYDFAHVLGSKYGEDKTPGMAPPVELCERLLSQFTAFQLKAKSVHEQVEATKIPVDVVLAEQMLLDYAEGLAREMAAHRDRLRRTGMKAETSIEHDTLCFCLAVLELVTETALRRFAPAAPGLLRWYCRHYLEGEEDASDWYQDAQCASSDDILSEDSPFWVPVCRLALADRKAEVLQLLKGSSARQDDQVLLVCDFLSKFPSMREMELAGASAVEFCQAIVEMHDAAQTILHQMPEKHPLRQLLQLYSRCSQAEFESNKDVSWKFSRTWIEDFVFTHAWVFPDLRRAELGDLLQAVARRRQDENIDDVDRAFIAAVKCDVPVLLELLTSMADKFPKYFVVHLVDLLYYAGRLPLSSGKGDSSLPPRDWHLIAYAADLCHGPQQLRCALNYLRAGGSAEVAKCMQVLADKYCANAVEDQKMLWEALAVLEDLELTELGRPHCWQRARLLRGSGNLLGALSWACWAVVGISEAGEEQSSDKGDKGAADISEFCDEMAEDDMAGLLTALAPANLEESFDDCPSSALLASMAPPGAPKPLPTLPASARLYFFIQYARCHALHAAGRPTASWAPVLVKLLSHGFASPAVQLQVLQEELSSVLEEDPSPFEAEEVLALMRIAHLATAEQAHKEPSERVKELHRSLGLCLSRAILQGSGRLGKLESPAGMPPALMA